MDRKVFISMPMRGRTSEAIENSITELKWDIAANTQGKCEFLNTIVKDEPPQNGNQVIWYLGKSIEILAQANTLAVPKQRDQYPGCQVEALIGRQYGLSVVEYDVKDVCPDLEVVEILAPKNNIFDSRYWGKGYNDVKEYFSYNDYELYSILFFAKGMDVQELLDKAFDELYKIGKINCSGLIFKLKGETYYCDPDGWSKVED